MFLGTSQYSKRLLGSSVSPGPALGACGALGGRGATYTDMQNRL